MVSTGLGDWRAHNPWIRRFPTPYWGDPLPGSLIRGHISFSYFHRHHTPVSLSFHTWGGRIFRLVPFNLPLSLTTTWNRWKSRGANVSDHPHQLPSALEVIRSTSSKFKTYSCLDLSGTHRLPSGRTLRGGKQVKRQ